MIKPSQQNAILSRLGPAVLRELATHLSSVSLEQGHIIVDSGQHVSSVIFPHEGVLSCVVETIEGAGIQTSTIGRDGVFGGLQALDHRTSINKVVVQVSCKASSIDCNRLKVLALRHVELRDMLVQYEQFNLAQVQQTAACNAIHSVEQRTCKWLLRMHDLVGIDLPLTQDGLAQMIGVRRTSITTTAGKLQDDGLIKYSRGKLRIVDLEAISENACECADIIKNSYHELLGERSSRVNGDRALPTP